MFKTVIILCLVIQQQCFIVEEDKPTIKTFKEEAECVVAAEKFANEVIANAEGNLTQPHFIRYGCEEVELI